MAVEAPRPSSQRKQAAILEAAETVFLRDGFVGASVDEVVSVSGVSKQTIYNHFGSKERLFVAVVSAMTRAAGDAVHPDEHELPDPDELAGYLEDYLLRQATVVLRPRILRLRRLVIGEVERFPDLARTLWEDGPARAMGALAVLVSQLDAAGLVRAPDARVAASSLNWLVMSGPLNAAMLLGDGAVPDEEALRRHTREAVRVFLAAYAPA